MLLDALAGVLTSIVIFATVSLSTNSVQQQATDPAANHKLVAAIVANLRRLYVDRATGNKLADALLAHDKNGDYQSFGTGPGLAVRINGDIQTAARALRLPRGLFVADVVYSERPLPTGPPPPMTAEMRERNRAALLQQNCRIETIETLPPNVGYVKLNGFPDATACRETIARNGIAEQRQRARRRLAR
ncbi:MAG TPA: hypothetical protein VGH34_11730 [Vicinamibacterales bacterium]